MQQACGDQRNLKESRNAKFCLPSFSTRNFFCWLREGGGPTGLRQSPLQPRRRLKNQTGRPCTKWSGWRCGGASGRRSPQKTKLVAKNNMGDDVPTRARQTLQPRGKSLIGLFGRPCTRWSGRGSKGRWRRRTAFSAVVALSKQVAGPESASRLVRSKCGSRGACACPARQAFPWVFDAAQAEEAPRGTTEPPSLAASVWPEERTHGLRGLSQSLASRRRATQRCRPARRLRALDLHRTWKPEARELKSIFTEPTANDSESTRRARETSNHLVRPPNFGSYTSSWLWEWVSCGNIDYKKKMAYKQE